MAEVDERQAGGDDGQHEGEQIAPRMVDLGHALEVHAVPRGDEGHRRRDDRDHGEHLHDLAGPVGRHVEVDLEDAGEGVHVAVGQLADVEEPVVHVAVVGHQVAADELELAPGEALQDLALGADDLAQVEHLLLHLEDLLQRGRIGPFQHLGLQLGDLHAQLLESRLVVVDQRVEQRVGHTVGGAGHVDGAAQAAFLDDRDAPQRHGVVGDQEVLPEEEVQLAGGEGPVLAAVVDRMDDHEQVGVEAVVLLGLVGLDLRRGALVDAVLDRERVEVEHALEQLAGVVRRRVLQIHPQEQVGVRQEGRHQEQVDVPGMEPSGGGEGERADHIGRMADYPAGGRRQSGETGVSPTRPSRFPWRPQGCRRSLSPGVAEACPPRRSPPPGSMG